VGEHSNKKSAENGQEDGRHTVVKERGEEWVTELAATSEMEMEREKKEERKKRKKKNGK